MEFFSVPCPGKGKVSIDGVFQGDSKVDEKLHVFQCNEGTHEIAMACLVGRTCRRAVQEMVIAGTNPILPQEVTFTCAS